MSGFVSFEFEITGKVQGVFFRKYTQAQAVKLGITGFVQNTDSGSVVGKAEGTPRNMNSFKQWLQTTGSGRRNQKLLVLYFEMSNLFQVNQVQAS